MDLFNSILQIAWAYLDVLCEVFDSRSWAKPFYAFLLRLGYEELS